MVNESLSTMGAVLPTGNIFLLKKIRILKPSVWSFFASLIYLLLILENGLGGFQNSFLLELQQKLFSLGKTAHIQVIS